MAKLKSDPVSQKDLIEFLNDQSDFSFEIQILNMLIGEGFTCEHNGTYDDPATEKPREFDIRATRVFNERLFLRLAVECKNLRPNFPLLISCLPRRDEEAFHEVVCSVNPRTNPIEVPDGLYSIAMLQTSKSIRVTYPLTPYKAGAPVGKSCDQVGRVSSGDITSGDSGIYEKWAQALSSASDLTALACSDGNDRTGDMALALVIPVVVVPNDRLWRTQYDALGNRTADPEQTDRCPYFVGRQYYHSSGLGSDRTTLSHLEFVTSDGLLQLVRGICGSEQQVQQAFTVEHVVERVVSEIRSQSDSASDE
jgi:hypothetical protein